MPKSNLETQMGYILRHLHRKGYITSMQAFDRYNTTRLSSIIFKLKKKGHPIDTDMVSGTHAKTGRATRFAVYKLVK